MESGGQIVPLVVPYRSQMADIDDLLQSLKANPANVRFADLRRVCDEFFGEPRQSGSSHRVYRTPWPGDPRVNIQNDHGRARAYQVRQVLKAIERLEREDETRE